MRATTLPFALLLAPAFSCLGAPPAELGDAVRLTPAEVEKQTSKKATKAAGDGPVAGFDVDTTDRFDVLDLYHTAYLPSQNYAATHGWNGSVSGCQPGTISNDLTEDTRRRVNYFRAMAGLSSDITFDAAKAAKCQQAALIMSRQNGLSHNPDIHFPTNPCLTPDGTEAAGKSNLSLGSYGPGAVEGQLIDDGSNNARVGHRRWILYSRAAEMATGDIPGDGSFRPTNALWVIGDFTSAPSPAPAIAWPPEGHVPYHLVPSEAQDFPRWSYGYPGADFTGADVTMKRGNTVVPVTLETVDTGTGDNAIVWRPQGIPSTKPEDDITYTVTITGIAGAPFSSRTYDVTLIDPYDLGTDVTTAGPTSPSTGQPNNYTFNTVPNATAYRTLAAPYTTGAWTEGAETSPAPEVLDGTDASYPLLESSSKASGSRAFHLAIPEFGADDSFVIDRDLVPLAGSAVTFKYRRLFMHPDSTLHVQLSVDDGQSFTTIDSIAGNNDSGSSAQWDPASFLTASSAVPARFQGRHVKIRFLIEDDGTTYIGTSTSHGIYIDNVSMTNHHELTGGTPVTQLSNASAFSHTPGAVGESRLLMAGAELGGRFWGYGPALAVTSVAAPAGPSPSFATYAANNGISAEPGTDHDNDGFPSLLEWALGLSDPADPASTPLLIAGTTTAGPDTFLTASYLRFTGGTESGNTYTHTPLTYTAQAATDLATWTLVPTHTTTAPNLPAPPPGFAWATVRFPTPAGTQATGAVRIAVELP